jgi:hypothetical protein
MVRIRATLRAMLTEVGLAVLGRTVCRCQKASSRSRRSAASPFANSPGAGRIHIKPKRVVPGSDGSDVGGFLRLAMKSPMERPSWAGIRFERLWNTQLGTLKTDLDTVLTTLTQRRLRDGTKRCGVGWRYDQYCVGASRNTKVPAGVESLRPGMVAPYLPQIFPESSQNLPRIFPESSQG